MRHAGWKLAAHEQKRKNCRLVAPAAASAGDALRTGTYSKTLTFTLSTTNP